MNSDTHQIPPNCGSEQSARASALADVRRSETERIETIGVSCVITGHERLSGLPCRDAPGSEFGREAATLFELKA